MKSVAVCLAVALADGLWALWIGAVAANPPVLAGLYSVGLICCGAYVTVAYVQDRRQLIPASVGAFVGTYLSVRYG